MSIRLYLVQYKIGDKTLTREIADTTPELAADYHRSTSQHKEIVSVTEKANLTLYKPNDRW